MCVQYCSLLAAGWIGRGKVLTQGNFTCFIKPWLSRGLITEQQPANFQGGAAHPAPVLQTQQKPFRIWSALAEDSKETAIITEQGRVTALLSWWPPLFSHPPAGRARSPLADSLEGQRNIKTSKIFSRVLKKLPNAVFATGERQFKDQSKSDPQGLPNVDTTSDFCWVVREGSERSLQGHRKFHNTFLLTPRSFSWTF